MQHVAAQVRAEQPNHPAATTAKAGSSFRDGAQVDAFRRLQQRVGPSLEVYLRPETSTPIQIKGNPLAKAATSTGDPDARSEATARTFLRDSAALLLLENPDEELRLAKREAERLVVQRVGQDIFRHGLMEYWEGRCAITGLAIPELLRASHIKPWANCATDVERLDVYNGLLLAPHLDALFDQGFITVADDGKVIVSTALNPTACKLVGVGESASWRVPITGHRAYLQWHRERVFKECKV